MLEYLLAVIAGLIVLVLGADRFVAGASALARSLGLAPLVIGLTVVAVGTSAPEILVSATAAWEGSPAIAVGNAVGSNIANIGLVLGVSALLAPMAVRSGIVRRELPLLIGVSALAWLLLGDGRLDRADGAILLAGGAALVLVMARLGGAGGGADPLGAEFAREIPAAGPAGPAALRTGLGLVLLLGGSRLVVWGAAHIALALHVSELVVGLTIVAVGTSLPELAASLMSLRRREPDIAIGNVIGSNMFNLLPVLALPGLIAPHGVERSLLARDLPVMMGLTVALMAMAWGFRGPGRITRWEGGALALAFVAYQSLLYFSARG